MKEKQVAIPYLPRKAFLPYHASKLRFRVTLAHRRAGKTVARINQLLRSATQCKLRAPRYAYIDPELGQAKRTAWDYLQYYARPILERGGKANQSELYIELPHNGAQIRLYGAENAQSIRGSYFDGVVLDEAQGISRTVLNTIVLPALADRQGWLDVSGTAHGRENLLGELVQIAQENPSQWFYQVLKASETGIIPATELEVLRRVMSENEYRQEFECDLDAAITGAIYGEQMLKASDDGRIRKVDLDPEKPVNTSWDLGFDDATAIWWWQVYPGEIRIIDYWEGSHIDVPGLVKIVKDRKYTYGDHYVPHDAAQKLLAAGGRSIIQQMFELGLKTRKVDATSQQNSIEALRLTLARCYFDVTRCKDGISALRQYQFEFDSERKIFKSKPKHDWTSHGCDALEIMAQVWREPVKETPKPRIKFLHEMTADELFWPKKRAHRTERI